LCDEIGDLPLLADSNNYYCAKCVSKSKYLGQLIINDLSDDDDNERQTRNMFVCYNII